MSDVQKNIKEATTPTTTPVRVSETTKIWESGGEQNNGPAKPTKGGSQ